MDEAVGRFEAKDGATAVQEQARWWLRTAETDLRTAVALIREGIYNNAAFHLQQAAAKALKALLIEMGEREPTHSGMHLMVILERLGIRFPEGLSRDLRRLDRSYIDSRYPNGAGGPPEDFYDREIAEELMQCCTRVMEFVKSKIN